MRDRAVRCCYLSAVSAGLSTNRPAIMFRLEPSGGRFDVGSVNVDSLEWLQRLEFSKIEPIAVLSKAFL